MKITDTVFFCMPKDEELQFPAMSMLQAYVNAFQPRMKANDASHGKATYSLRYAHDMSMEDWEFFRRAGFEVDVQPEETSSLRETAEFLIVMSDVAILPFMHTGKHAGQACAVCTGTQGELFYPRLRRVVMRKDDPVWLDALDVCALELLLDAQDDQYTGVIGPASRFTFLAAAMGLAVIEIVPEGRPMNWLSKFANPWYRYVDAAYDVDSQVTAALNNINGLLGRMVALERERAG